MIRHTHMCESTFVHVVLEMTIFHNTIRVIKIYKEQNNKKTQEKHKTKL